ncbi:MAG: tryptophan synthase subunit alpha [Gemmataceae bacterium]
MNPIDSLFAETRASKRTALIPFLPAGDPDLAFTAQALPALAQGGASLIEIGFPFSDPIADGPVIQASYTRALSQGLKVDAIFESLGTVTRQATWKTPAVAMASFSLIWRKGPVAFLKEAKAAGFSGIVAPDLPAEEAEEFSSQCRDQDMKLILLVTPTTEKKRTERIVKTCSGFVYVVGVVGITGARANLSNDLPAHLATLRTMTDLPLCVGFGVSTPDHVKALKGIADGVIVGSALVKTLENPDRNAALAGLTKLAKEMADAAK